MSVVKRVLSYLKPYRGYFAWTMLFCIDWNWVVFGDSHSNWLFCGLYDWTGGC